MVFYAFGRPPRPQKFQRWQVVLPYNLRKPWQVFKDQVQEFAEVVGGFSPFSWENQTWRNFFANVDYHTAAVSQRCSMIELACYIRFAEKNPHDLGAWYRLTEDEMRAYRVPHVEKFLRYELAWQKQVEEFVPEIRNTRDGLMDDMPDEMQKVGKAFAELLAVGRVEDSLLDPYEWQPVSLGKMMSYGQVFHACAAACHRVWGDQWPLKIAVFNGLSEQHDDRLAMHMKAHIICALLYTDSHWACLFYKRGDPKAFVADGLKDHGCRQGSTSSYQLDLLVWKLFQLPTAIG